MAYQAPLPARFAALADPTRLAMVEQLSRGAAPVAALAAPHGLALPTILRHLKVLEEAGLISTRKAGRQRLCALNAAALADTGGWLSARIREWEARLDRLDALALTLDAEETPDG
jgi:DNA-binding transcriptional ArsR family regulator